MMTASEESIRCAMVTASVTTILHPRPLISSSCVATSSQGYAQESTSGTKSLDHAYSNRKSRQEAVQR